MPRKFFGPRIFFGWWITAAAFVTSGLTVGVPYYNIGFFYDYFQRAFGWSRADITLGLPLAALLTLWAGPLVIHRFSPRKLIIVGSGLTAISLAMFAKMGPSLWIYYAIFLLYMSGYIFSGPIPHQLIVSHWFRRNRGKAMAIVYVGNGLMGSLGSLLVKPLTERYRIPGSPHDPGRVHSSLLADCDLHSSRQTFRHGTVSRRRRAPPAEASRESHSFAQLLSSYSFWLLLIGSFCSIGAVGAINFHMKFVFLDEGFTKGPAVDSAWRTASVLILWSSVGGRLLVGGLADRFSKKLVMTATFVLVADHDSESVIRASRSSGIAVRLLGLVRLRPGRRLHADPADGRRTVRHQQPGPRDGRDSAGQHHRPDLAALWRLTFARSLRELYHRDERGAGGRASRCDFDCDSS